MLRVFVVLAAASVRPLKTTDQWLTGSAQGLCRN